MVTGWVLCSGCLSPNTYSTPRTVSPGKLSHSVALEGVEWFTRDRAATDPKEAATRDGAFPMAAYTLRVGATERLDFGLRVSGMTGVDMKANFLRTKPFDLAIDPGFQTTVNTVGPWTGALHLPAIVGLNLSRSFSVVGTAGYSHMLGDGKLEGVMASSAPMSGPMIRAGVGLDIRISSGFALHPELTWMRRVIGDHDPLNIWVGGLGFNWGTLPEH